MSRLHLQTILRHAESLATDPSAVGDSELLARFLATRDDRAFSALVRRHGAMVWSVCRNLLPADADAEDAFQATFLALVRSGGRIRDGERLASWLHGVAFRVAMKVRRTSAKRRIRESIAATSESTEPVSESSWNDLLAAVHEEVERLPESLRSAFVLCCLEGVRQHDAADQLGLKVNTLTARLGRARQRVLERLARRGIAVGAATGAIAVGSATGRATVPTVLADRTEGFARSPESVSPTVLTLSQGAFEMNLRTKWLAAALLVAGAMTTTVGTVFFSNATGQFPGGGGRGGDGGGRGGGGAAGGSPNSPAAMISRMTPAWEYKVAKFALHTADAEKDLNKLGDEGWELTVTNDQGMLVFKRQKARQFPFGEGGRGGPGGVGGAGAIGGSADSGTGTAVEKKVEATSTHVIPIKHARATSLATTIAPLLGAEETNRSPFGGSGGFSANARRTPTGRLNIAVDDRTNSIIVITDDATLKTIKELVEKLDVQVKEEPTKPSK